MEKPKKDLVAARMRFIERMRDRLHVSDPAPEPMGSGPANRHGKPKLPVGQSAVREWPVLDLGHTPEVPKDAWRLELAGCVENPVTLDFAGLLELPQVELDVDFHCVTTWSLMDTTFGGVRFRDLAELVVPTEEARFVLCTGYDFAPGTDIPYTTNLPLERALEEDVMVVHRWNGADLPVEHGGPVRMVTPRLYAWKGTKWIKRIEFAAEDEPGFWEVRGYSNTAEPWRGDRFSQPGW